MHTWMEELFFDVNNAETRTEVLNPAEQRFVGEHCMKILYGLAQHVRHLSGNMYLVQYIRLDAGMRKSVGHWRRPIDLTDRRKAGVFSCAFSPSPLLLSRDAGIGVYVYCAVQYVRVGMCLYDRLEVQLYCEHGGRRCWPITRP